MLALVHIHIQWIVGIIFIILYCVTILGLVLVIITENRNPLKTIPWVIVLLLAPGIGLLFYFFFGRTAMELFLDESSAAAIQAGVDYMHIVTPFYFIVTIKVMCDGVLRGGSAMLYFMTTTFTDLFLRVTLAFLFAKGLGLGATGIWMAWPIGWTLSTLLSIFFYRLKPWLKKDL